MDGDEFADSRRAGVALRAGGLAFRRRQIAGHGIRRADQRRRSQAPRADPGEPGIARRVARHQYAVRRHPDDHAGRDRAGPPSCLLSHSLRAGRRGRLYRRRRREGVHVAWRFCHHRQLGAARSRQHLRQADAVARRARRAGGQFLRNLVRRGFRQPDAGDDAARRQLTELLCLGRAAGRHARR